MNWIRKKGLKMSKAKVPTQTSHRSSTSGRFVTERFADRHPNTTERERIKHPERK
jgi:hypothetical protein